MEKYDIGIPLMFSSYQPYGIEPKLLEFPRALMIVLPKIKTADAALSAEERAAVEYLRERGPTKRSEIQAALDASYGTIISMLNSLAERGIIIKTGSGRTTRYRLN